MNYALITLWVLSSFRTLEKKLDLKKFNDLDPVNFKFEQIQIANKVCDFGVFICVWQIFVLLRLPNSGKKLGLIRLNRCPVSSREKSSNYHWTKVDGLP